MTDYGFDFTLELAHLHEPVEVSDFTGVYDEFHRALEKTLAEAYLAGAVVVDVVWVADSTDPQIYKQQIFIWWGEPGPTAYHTGASFHDIIRYSLKDLEFSEFEEALEKSVISEDDLDPQSLLSDAIE